MFKSTVHFDWLSFTVPCYPEPFDKLGGFPDFGEYALLAALGTDWAALSGKPSDWLIVRSRPPYTIAVQRDGMITLYAGGTQTHVLVEISGRGCKHLRDLGIERSILGEVKDRVSRIDIAHDFQTQITPMAVVEAGHSSAFKTITTISSKTGETVYVGSAKSVRRCRIYRYAPPHPRSGVLRFEYVFRKKAAKQIAKMAEYSDMEEMANGCIDMMKWEHSMFDQEREKVKLPLHREERGQAKAMRWVLTQVAPAIRQLITDKVIIDPEDFFRANFIP